MTDNKNTLDRIERLLGTIGKRLERALLQQQTAETEDADELYRLHFERSGMEREKGEVFERDITETEDSGELYRMYGRNEFGEEKDND